jgi:hypothetical protein
MRISTRRAAAVLALVPTLVAGAGMTPAAAATKNPCKLVKARQIEEIFGAPVAKGKKGLSTAVSKTCEFTVDATASNPEGGVYTYLQFVGAEVAFDTNKETLGDSADPIDGLGDDAFFQSDIGGGGVVWVLKGDVLLNVQGVFFSIGDDPVLDPTVLRDGLLDVAKIAVKKA